MALFGASFTAQAQTPGTIKAAAKAAKITPDLYQVLQNNGSSAPVFINGFTVDNNQVFMDGKIAIEAVANNDDGQGLLNQLNALGLTGGVAYKRMIFGYLPIDKLDDLKNVSSLSYARSYYKPVNNTGSVTSQGDAALKADIARTTYSTTGAGVKVGIISDSYNRLGGAAAGIASGDLPPAGVQVLLEATSGGTDEGRAMAEIVYDVAPGSALAFNTSGPGQAGFAQGIINLAAAGCQVIVDDVIYLAEPFFQDGVIAQAVDQVVTAGATYFSAAGNQARSSYQAPYKNGGTYTNSTFYGTTTAYPTHDFGSGTVDNLQRISIPSGGSLRLVLQWDQPFQSVSGGLGATTDLDVLILDATTGNILTFGAADQSAGGDPVEITGTVTNSTGAARLVDVIVVKYAGPDPGLLKWVNFGSRFITTEYDTKSAASYGHSNSAKAISVGAAPYFNTPVFNAALTTATIENFSSAGGTPILFTTTGTRINGITGTVRQKPEITAVDGGDNTFFGSDYEGNGKPNFFGTSAAAPHAAGVAALMKSKVPAITPAAILTTLENTALDMDDPFTAGFDTGFDFGTGFGFIQADKALQAISPVVTSLSLTASASPTMIQTSGSTTITALASGGTTPYSYTFAGPGTITPSGNSATVSGLMAGVQTFTVTAKDATTPTNQVATATVSVTVTAAPPTNTPPMVANMIPNQSATVGQPFSYLIPANTFTDAETPNQLTLSVSGLPAGLMFTAPATISGTPSMSGTSNVTVTATDPGGLSASTMFALTVNPASMTVTPGGNFAITGVTTVSCMTVTATRRELTFTPQYSGVNGQPISFSIVNELAPTTAPGPYTVAFYIDKPLVTLKATQTGTAGEASFDYNWLAACGVTNPPEPTGTFAITAVTTLSCTPVAGDANRRSLTFTPRYSGANGQPISFSVVNELAATTEPGPYTLGVYVDKPTLTLSAKQSGTDGEATFVYNWLAVCGTTPPDPEPTGTFAITAVTTVSCTPVVGDPNRRELSFTPRYAGTNGQPISFSVVNEKLPTTAPGPYTLGVYVDKPTITLSAVQTGSPNEATFVYNWLSVCNSGSARLGAEPGSGLQVQLLGNPVVGGQVSVWVRGALGQALNLTLSDVRGRVVGTHTLEAAGSEERHSFEISQQPNGLLLLKVSTPAESKTIKVLKGE